MMRIDALKRQLRTQPSTRAIYRLLGEAWQRIRIASVKLRAGRYHTAQRFDRLFLSSRDPWGYKDSPIAIRRHRLLLEALPKPKYRRMLDIGCAEGWISHSLAQRAEHLVAVDISGVALERAEGLCQDLTNVEFRRLDILDEPVGEGFDAIVCAGVLVYFDFADQTRIRDRLVAALEDGGHLLLEHQTESYPGQLAGRRIHALYAEHPDLIALDRYDADNYSVLLLQKTTAPAGRS